MKTDIHIYLQGWFLGDEEAGISHDCLYGTDCQAEYKTESVSITVDV